jgi:fructan beta-fructosidase
LFIDRRQAGNVGFHGDFPARHEGPINLSDGKLHLRVYIDWSMVEVFGNDGETVLTDRFFPSHGANQLYLYANDGEATVTELQAWDLKSIWR